MNEGDVSTISDPRRELRTGDEAAVRFGDDWWLCRVLATQTDPPQAAVKLLQNVGVAFEPTSPLKTSGAMTDRLLTFRSLFGA